MNNFKVFDSNSINLQSLNQPYFYDRLYYCIKEDGFDIPYGEFNSRVLKNGMIKVLKSLGLYYVKGGRELKKIYVHEKLLFIINTTIANGEVVAKTLMDSENLKISRFEFNGFEEFLLLSDEYPHSVDNSKCTYIIYNPINGLYKIGKSSDIFLRLNRLRSEITFRLELVAYIDKDFEYEIHKSYSSLRVFGEWFSISINDILDIKNKYNLNIIQLPS